MRAHVENTASRISLAITVAVSIFLVGPKCSAQVEQTGGRHLVLFIYNYSDLAIAPGEIELREIRDGAEEPVSTISTVWIPRGDYTWTYFPDPLLQGQRYRVIFRAEFVNDATKIVYRESQSFIFRSSENWRSLRIDRDDVRDRGNLVRLEFGKGLNAPDVIFAKPGDLIEIDYMFQRVQPSVEPKGGSRPQVVDVSRIGPRPVVVNGKTVGVASFFDAKSRGDDWVSIETGGSAHNYHIFVRSK
jgi:hypothetical protein